MSKPAKKKLSYEEELSRKCRSLWVAETVLMPLGTVAIAVIAKDVAPYNKVSPALLILLALIFGTSVGFIVGWLSGCLVKLLIPTKPKAREMRLAMFSIMILAPLLTWLRWSDVPTNAQIDAVHNDPHFAAAIAEINEKHLSSDLLAAEMSNRHAHVNRYIIFAIETVLTFVVLLILFSAFFVIFKALSFLFTHKVSTTDATTD